MSIHASKTYVDCPTCQLHGQPVDCLDAAEQLAALHDQLHHRGHPTAVLHSEPEMSVLRIVA
jgi:hypothetical protein